MAKWECVLSASPPVPSVARDVFCRKRIQSARMTLGLQLVWLLVLGIPVACMAWTVTHEEVFREPRQYCQRQCAQSRSFVRRKFFYLFTCEYCFSHYVSAAVLILSRYKLLYTDWRTQLLLFFTSFFGASYPQRNI